MRRLPALVATLFLAACASTPTEVRETGTQTTFQSAKAPKEMARCLAGVIDEYNKPLVAWPMTSHLREGTAAAHYEVRGTAKDQAMFIGDVAPAGSGSRVVLYQNRAMLWGLDIPQLMADTCR